MEEEDALESKYLMCVIGKEEYGINIVDVQSIEELQKIVHIPDMPDYVRGVINLRGRVLPVIDLRLKFRMDRRDYDDRTCIVIVRMDPRDIGLIVDTVSEVQDIPEGDIESTPAFSGDGEEPLRNKYIRGLGKVGTEVKILLDTSRLLKAGELEKILRETN